MLLYAETAQRADDDFTIILAGHYTLKVLTEEQALFALQGRDIQRVEIAYDSTLIGRLQELEQLERFLQPILHGQFGGFTLIRGEAGIGKSRLVDEVLNKLCTTTATGIFLPNRRNFTGIA